MLQVYLGSIEFNYRLLLDWLFAHAELTCPQAEARICWAELCVLE